MELLHRAKVAFLLKIETKSDKKLFFLPIYVIVCPFCLLFRTLYDYLRPIYIKDS